MASDPSPNIELQTTQNASAEQEIDTANLTVDEQIALIENGTHPLFISSQKELEKHREDELWVIETWKKFQLESIEKQAEVMLNQAKVAYDEKVEAEKKRLLSIFKHKKRRDDERGRRRTRRRDHSAGDDDSVVDFAEVEKLSAKEINKDLMAIQQGIITL